MDWVLVILTFYSPHVDLKITEITYGTSTECTRAMEYHDDLFTKLMESESRFGYTIRCEPRSRDDEYVD